MPLPDDRHARIAEILRIANRAALAAQVKNRRLGIANWYSLAGRLVSDQGDVIDLPAEGVMVRTLLRRCKYPPDRQGRGDRDGAEAGGVAVGRLGRACCLKTLAGASRRLKHARIRASTCPGQMWTTRWKTPVEVRQRQHGRAHGTSCPLSEQERLSVNRQTGDRAPPIWSCLAKYRRASATSWFSLGWSTTS